MHPCIVDQQVNRPCVNGADDGEGVPCGRRRRSGVRMSDHHKTNESHLCSLSFLPSFIGSRNHSRFSAPQRYGPGRFQVCNVNDNVDSKTYQIRQGLRQQSLQHLVVRSHPRYLFGSAGASSSLLSLPLLALLPQPPSTALPAAPTAQGCSHPPPGGWCKKRRRGCVGLRMASVSQKTKERVSSRIRKDVSTNDERVRRNIDC